MELCGVKSRQAVHAWMSGVTLPRTKRMLVLELVTGIAPREWMRWWSQKPKEDLTTQTAEHAASPTNELAGDDLSKTNAAWKPKQFSSADPSPAQGPASPTPCEAGCDKDAHADTPTSAPEDSPSEEGTQTKACDGHYLLRREFLDLLATGIVCCLFVTLVIALLWAFVELGPSAPTAALGLALVSGVLGGVVGAKRGSRLTTLATAILFSLAGGMAGLLVGGIMAMLVYPVTQALGGR